MSGNDFSDEMLMDYLLRLLSEEARRSIDERYFADDDLEDRLDAAERDLIDSYVRGELSEERRRCFEERFTVSETRGKKIRFARVLHEHLSAESSAVPSTQGVRPTAAPSVLKHPAWRVRLSELGGSTFLRVAATLIVAGVIGFVLWSISSNRSDLKQGVQALEAAYAHHRDLESRVSGFSYAPATVIRGNDREEEDQRYRELAARLLTKAVILRSDGQSHHALGRLYFAEGKFDEAIREFDAALPGSGTEPALYSDLGAAHLEKARSYRSPAMGEASELEKRELGSSLDYLNQALAKNPALPEALFDRALCYELLKAPDLARADWEQYLRIDPGSGWALEAKDHLRRLNETAK